jgi:NitT/TauT family transport system ATP-binding protein
LISFKNVSRSFDGALILNHVSFEIDSNETIAVLGPSGSGKTTLLKLIAGLLKPDSGTISLSSRHIGYVFQDYRLLPWRTALGNIVLVLKAGGMAREEAESKARSWLDRLGLKDFYDYYPAQLSGGMIQRVSIARAFAIKPEIMLMDEPLSNLDAGLADSLLRELKEVLEDYHTTTVYVTHEYAESLFIAHRIFQLEQQTLKETVVGDRKIMLQNYLAQRFAQFT